MATNNSMAYKKQENPLINIGINIIAPSIVLLKFSSDAYLGPLYGLLVALAFPLVYGVIDLIRTREYNFISILGVVSTLLTGGIGVLELPTTWLAVKEAAVPSLIGIAILISAKTKFPLVKKLLYQMIDPELVESKLPDATAKELFERKTMRATYIVAFSFLVSAILNYTLAKIIVVSPPGTPEFTAELGRLTALSYPVIAVPSTIIMIIGLVMLIRDIEKITGLDMQTLVQSKKG